ncbi:phosphoadenylyl-sulfate reductase [Brevibacterium litoralis]|uniref:phosphoadenylyl-sulfate reductase n=1 Tax=Brevibacterium litoralis TaxID=3138935 RepID=UPI0032EEBA55
MTVDIRHWKKFSDLAERAGDMLDGSGPDEVLSWAVETFGDRLCLTSSMADAVLIDVASRVKPGIDVVFLDTGYHFPETLATRQEVEDRYRIDLTVLQPEQSVREQDAEFGAKLHDRDPDFCCWKRKVEPLQKGLEPYDAWMSGIRRDESAARAHTRVVEWDENRGMVKVNPLANWTQAEVDAYIEEHDVVLNPLLDQGYPSIGCAPCTRKVKPGEDPRAGRWAGFGKTECGLHLDSAPSEAAS